MTNTHDVQQFVFFNHENPGRTGEALLKMTEEDHRAYRDALMRLGEVMDINAPGDAPIGPEAEKIFNELQKMFSDALSS